MDMYSVGVVLEDLYPEPTTAMLELINSLKAEDPGQRLSACEALQHGAFGVDNTFKVYLICMEEKEYREGTSCEKGHLICKYCAASSVGKATEPQAHVLVDAEGTMACMKPGCDGRIPSRDITRLAPDAVNHLLLIARIKVESEAAIRAEQEVQRRIAEFLGAEGSTRDTVLHLRYIQDNILNVCCPSCNTCFDQFDGCCAVKCGNDACGHHFCAWCREFSSHDSNACHNHVRTCP